MKPYNQSFAASLRQHNTDIESTSRLKISTLITKTLGGYIPKQQQLFGLIVVFAGSLVSIWLNGSISNWTDGKQFGLSSLTLAILIGMLLGNTLYPKLAPSLSAGVSFSKAQILRLAIVLYGFKITLTQVASVGLSTVVIDALVLTSTFSLTYLLGTKWLKIDTTTTLLIGSGASICGAAAVVATESVVKAKSHQVTIAVATVVVFGTLSMMIYPMVFQWIALNTEIDSQLFGIYIGSTIHEVAQVVVAGNAISPEVGNTAVVAKMIRVMMLAPFLLVLSLLIYPRSLRSDDTLRLSDKPSRRYQKLMRRLKQIQIPWFAFVFISMIGLNSALSMSDFTVRHSIQSVLIELDDLLLTMAMFALGLTTQFSAIKQAGTKPLILAAIVFVWLIVGGAMINLLLMKI